MEKQWDAIGRLRRTPAYQAMLKKAMEVQARPGKE